MDIERLSSRKYRGPLSLGTHSYPPVVEETVGKMSSSGPLEGASPGGGLIRYRRETPGSLPRKQEVHIAESMSWIEY